MLGMKYWGCGSHGTSLSCMTHMLHVRSEWNVPGVEQFVCVKVMGPVFVWCD